MLPTSNPQLSTTFSDLTKECCEAEHILMSAVSMLQCSSQGTLHLYAVEMAINDFLGVYI